MLQTDDPPRDATQSPLLLLDELMPAADAVAAVTVVVDALPTTTFEALKRIDFADMPGDDPLLRGAIAIRTMPDRLSRALRGEIAPAAAAAESGWRLGDMSEGPAEWVRLGESGAELSFGAIGQFLGAQVNWRPTTAAEFAGFADPGYVKVACSLSVRAYGARRSLLTYDCRSTATDSTTRRAFRRYWALLSPGIRFVMWRALAAFKREAER